MSLSTAPLRHPPAIGHYRVLAPLTSLALRDWFGAIDTTDSTPVWLYAISEARLKTAELDRNPPSLKLARQHSALNHAGLQQLSPPSLIDGHLLIVATPAVGLPLRDLIQSHSNQRLPVLEAIRLVHRITDALSAIHRAGLVHGRIGIDQVWWNGREEFTLMRDPFYLPASPFEPDAVSSEDTQNDRESRLRYAAPELTAPGQVPTPATDVYALGCLWWELLMGKSPFAETEVSQVPKAACKIPLAVAKEIELSSGHLKCLEHMLAKNPSSRFANSSQLLSALETIETATAPPPSPAPALRNNPTSAPSPAQPSKTAPISKPVPPSKQEPPSTPARSFVPTPTVTKQPPVQASSVPLESPALEVPPVIEVPPSISTLGNMIEAPATLPTLETPPREIPKAVKQTKRATSSSDARPAARRAGKKKGRPVWLIPAMITGCVAILGGLAGILAWTGSGSSSKGTASVPPKVVTDSSNNVAAVPMNSSTIPAPGTQVRVVDPLEDQYMIAKGDDSIPWLPPRASQPYSLSMLPPGAQGFIFVRPNVWLTTTNGNAIVESLGSAISTIWKPMEKSVGVPLDNIRELAIGLYGGRSDGWPVLVYRAELEESTTFAKLQEKLQGATEQTLANQRSMLVAGEQAIYLSPASEVSESSKQALTFGPVTLIRELAEMDGGAPLRRQMEQLWQVSDARSDLSLLLSTGFFFSDARNVLPSISPRIQSLCKEIFDEKTQAVLITTSIEPQWYGELRTIGQSSDDATRFIADLQTRMKSIADRMESELVASPASPYWRALAARFPQMLRSLVRYQRFGVENGQAISNFYLPSVASANLAIATWMSLQMPAAPTAISSNATQAPATAKLTGDSLLGHLVSINFEQEPLDSALALISEEVNRSLPSGSGPIELSIDGKSFELASVTRNQQIRDFRFKDKPLRDLLTDLAARVNPDRTVKSLDEVKQAVVWVLIEEAGKSKIVFTTRRGVEGTDRKIPKEFTKSAP
jgi:serine/threonine protein kinase